MAYTQYVQQTFSLVDAGGVRGSVVLYAKMDPTKTLAQVATDTTDTAVLLDCMTDCQILEARTEIVCPVTGTKDAPANEVNVEKTALLTFNDTQVPVRAYGQDIAGVASAILASTDRIDTSNGDYANWVALMLTPTAVTEYVDARQATLASIRSNAITFRKHRKSQSRVSTEAG